MITDKQKGNIASSLKQVISDQSELEPMVRSLENTIHTAKRQTYI